MSIFNFPNSIRSRPVYGTLQAQVGKFHLMIADAYGAEAILEMAAKAPALMAVSHVIYIPKGTDFGPQIQALKPAQYYEGPSYAAAVSRIQRVLSHAAMGH